MPPPSGRGLYGEVRDRGGLPTTQGGGQGEKGPLSQYITGSRDAGVCMGEGGGGETRSELRAGSPVSGAETGRGSYVKGHTHLAILI